MVDVDLVVGAADPLHVHCRVVERLEVAELVDAAEAVFERLGVERRPLGNAQLTADHVVAGLAVAGELDSVNGVRLAFLDADGDVRDCRRRGPARGDVRVGSELEVSGGTVGIAGALEAFANALLAVHVAGLQAEQRRQGVGREHRLSLDRHRSDPEPRPLAHRHSQLHPPGAAVSRVVEHAQRLLADLGLDVAVVAIELLDAHGVVGERRLVVGPAPGDQRQQPARPAGLQHSAKSVVRERGVADELHGANRHLGPLRDVEANPGQLRVLGQRRHVRRDLTVRESLLREQLTNRRGGAAQLQRIEECVEAKGDALLFQGVEDVGLPDAVEPLGTRPASRAAARAADRRRPRPARRWRTGYGTVSIARSSRKPVPHNRPKSSRAARSASSSSTRHAPSDASLGFNWM